MKKIISFIIICSLIVIFKSISYSEEYKIIVMPFDKLNKEQNSDLETLTYGISETLSGALANVKNFIVIDTSRIKKHLLENAEFSQVVGESDEKYIEKLRKLTQDKFDGDYLIYGSFNKIGNQILLNAKFCKIDTGKIIKAVSVHGQYPDKIFDLQDDLANKIIATINGTPIDSQNTAVNGYINSTVNYTAYQLYLKGRNEFLKYNFVNYPKAIEYFNKAIQLDKNFALAWSGMSEVNALWGYQLKLLGKNYKPKLKDAVEQGKKSVSLNGNIFQTHKALSIAYMLSEDFTKAGQAIKPAYALNENDAEIQWVKASLINFGYKSIGTPGSEANKYIMRSLKLNPDLIVARWSLGHSYEILGKNDEALSEYNKILAINPNHATSLLTIAIIYYKQKDYTKVIDYSKRSIQNNPEAYDAFYMLGIGYYSLKDWVNAEKNLRESIRLRPDYTNSIFYLGVSLYKQEQYKEARDYFKLVQQYKSDYPEAKKWEKFAEDKMK